MIQYLTFEQCKTDNKSRYFGLFLKGGDLYFETAVGYRGMYIAGNSNVYRCTTDSAQLISAMIGALKIYTWPKAIPSDYVPGEHLMGCDVDSWTIDYKEVEKKTARHIYGKGSFPVEEPYSNFIKYFVSIVPDKNLKEWLQSDYR